MTYHYFYKFQNTRDHELFSGVLATRTPVGVNGQYENVITSLAKLQGLLPQEIFIEALNLLHETNDDV